MPIHSEALHFLSKVLRIWHLCLGKETFFCFREPSKKKGSVFILSQVVVHVPKEAWKPLPNTPLLSFSS